MSKSFHRHHRSWEPRLPAISKKQPDYDAADESVGDIQRQTYLAHSQGSDEDNDNVDHSVMGASDEMAVEI